MKFNANIPESIVTNEVTIFWMRRDLRISDNAALYYALKENNKVLPVFIFDSEILKKLEDRNDRRVAFILESLSRVQDELAALNCSLLVMHGDPVRIFKKLNPRNVYTNRDYEGYSLSRDEQVASSLYERGIPFYTYKDHIIFEKDEVVKNDGMPYTVFTPYSRQWKAKLNEFYTRSYPCDKHYSSFLKLEPLPLPTLHKIGFTGPADDFPERIIPGAVIKSYHRTRDFPATKGTSRLGVHLRFGTVSIRKLVALAREKNETWLNELIWREFYSMILWHFPHVEHRAFKPVYDKLSWRNNEAEFDRWCEGRTGYPLVDAGMRELNATGFMHNRVRMVTASFLTKHLLIDWRWGEAYFARKLLDYELASNNGGWQWAAGCGCDAAPYFRVFNPHLQLKKFDPELVYVRRWIPEFGGPEYPQEIVEHAFARDRALQTYRKAVV